jgi:hypothetical protein
LLIQQGNRGGADGLGLIVGAIPERCFHSVVEGGRDKAGCMSTRRAVRVKRRTRFRRVYLASKPLAVR